MMLKFPMTDASQVRIKICYTLFMQSRADWSQWAESLRRFKLDGLASWLLEAGAPLTILGAQAIHISGPFLGGKQASSWNSLAHMLEEDQEVQAFARYLRGEDS
jgi:hypothetical protein